PGNVGVGEPRPWEGRTPPTVCPAPRRVPRLRQSARARESQVRDVPGLPPCPPAPRVSFSVVDLVSADLEEVAQKCGLSYKALVALRRVLLAQFSAFPFNGADLYEELKTSTAILSTGVGSPSVDALPSSSAISLDKLLDAGLYTGEVTEIVGAPGSGKTQ
ncbi:RAD51D, partial [Cervus elaphus hippelaphus]